MISHWKASKSTVPDGQDLGPPRNPVLASRAFGCSSSIQFERTGFYSNFMEFLCIRYPLVN